MEKPRFLLFMILAMLLFFANMWFIRWMNPPQPKQEGNPDGEAQAAEHIPLEAPPVAPPKIAEAPADPPAPRRWVSLGSADPTSGYRLEVVLTSRGAAVEWAAVNDPKYLDVDALFEKRGFLGYLALSAADGTGAQVNVVGSGSSAEAGGLQQGDVITSIQGSHDKEPWPVNTPADVERYLRERSHSDDQVTLEVIRKGAATLTVVNARLSQRPLELLQPEQPYWDATPASFLMSLAELDETKLLEKKKEATGITFERGQAEAVIDKAEGPAAKAGLKKGDKIIGLDTTKIQRREQFDEALTRETVPSGAILEVKFQRNGTDMPATTLELPSEISGVQLYDVDWQVTRATADVAEFRRKLPAQRLEIVKRYTLAKGAEGEAQPANYHLTLDVEIHSLDGTQHKVAYQIDGPQGLPTEGWWYASKVSRASNSGAGARDLVYSAGGEVQMQNAADIGAGRSLSAPKHQGTPFRFVAVDARYFAAAVKPFTDENVPDLQLVQPLIAGGVNPRDPARHRLTNTSFRLISTPAEIKADAPLRHSYQVFLGPKQRDVLANPSYELQDLVYYGYSLFSAVARLMAGILHFFYSIIPNYGVAIILLTVLVRLCMFPLSRKQALGAQKMQALQPEMKRIAERYKDNMEARAKAQRELFREHNYNPMAGCLPVFVQLPIFIGLYKGLSLDIELRQAPLISGLYWCSDLSAPDRLFRWDSFMPHFLSSETGWLGPYFNFLPIITIVLFLVQQKMFMPPPTDEQQAMQQKMMTFMMVFMGFMFFSVPSGLCIYFIASSLWGIAERKLLPKISHETAAVTVPAQPAADTRRNATPAKGKPRSDAKPGGAGVVQQAGNRLGDTMLGRLFKSLAQAADNQPKSEAGRRRPKKRREEK